VKILAVSATEAEITAVKKFAAEQKNAFIDVLITGVGGVATAYAVTKQLKQVKYDAALNFGIAGSFDKSIQLGTVVNVMYDCFADLGAEDGENFLSLAEMGLEGISELSNLPGITNPVLSAIPKVSAITVNKVHGSEESIAKTKRRYQPQTESMEGAAFLYCCMMEKIPCAQIRAVSNYVERRNKNNWNISLAIENLNKKAVEILEAL
jgi:futalosine hydrolase